MSVVYSEVAFQCRHLTEGADSRLGSLKLTAPHYQGGMAKLLFLSIYAVGFIAPLLVRSRRALVISVIFNICLIVGMILLAGTGGGFIMFVFAFPIMVFAVGSFVGHTIRLTLLLTNQNTVSSAGLLIVAIGAFLLPVTWEAWGLFKNWQSAKAYAELPKATTLPDIPACAAYRNAGPLLDAVLVSRPHDRFPDDLPPSEVPLIYPANYMEPLPPRFPKSGMKTSRLSFEMHVEDASPAPLDEERDEEGKTIPLMERQPSVHFDFSADIPTPRSSARFLNAMAGDFSKNETTPDLKLTPATVPGLHLVERLKSKSRRGTEIYVVMQENEIVQFIRCSGRGTALNPQCNFRFDVGAIPIEGRFRLANLPEWSNIRENIRRFADCSVAAARAS